MTSQSKRTHTYQAATPSLAHCKHGQILSYDLSESDQMDFCRRLDLVLKQNNSLDSGEFSLNFLTPSIRGQRARSMLATTRDSKNNVQSTISNIDEWSPEEQTLTQGDDQLSSVHKHRSNSRRPQKKNNRLPAPQVFRNCAYCGAFFINEDIVAVKPRQYCFRTEILPSQLICAFFEMQAEKRAVTRREDVDQLCGQDVYLEGRKRIIDGVYKMGVKFRQARETIHIAIEMIDQFYLASSQEMSAKQFKVKLMHPGAVILHQVTVLLIASKFDEIDDNITAIQDLREYVQKQVSHQQRRDFSLLPSFEAIVECERKLMVFFDWDLKFVLPLHIVRAYLANGVLFSNEFVDLIAEKKTHTEIMKLKADWSRSITTESLSISDLIVSKGNVTYRSESSSDIAASIIYLARKNILEADSPTGKSRVPFIWPQELVMITRCTEQKAKRILVDVLRPLEQQAQQPRQEQQQQCQSQRTLTDPKQQVIEPKSSTQRNMLPSASKTQRLSNTNGQAAVNSEQRTLEKYQKKDNMFMTKLSVLSQKPAQPSTQSDANQNIQETGITVREDDKSTAPVTDRASLFISKNLVKPASQEESRQIRAATFKQKIVKSQAVVADSEIIAKTASFADIPKSINAIRQAQSQRQLFQSTAPVAPHYQMSVVSAETVPVQCEDQVTDHLQQDELNFNSVTSQQDYGQRVITLTDEDENAETVEHNYQNDMKRRSTQPMAKQKLPSIAQAAMTRSAIQTCEKDTMSSLAGPMSERTQSSAIVVTEAGPYLNPKPSVASVSSIIPTVVSATEPFSTSRRPKNELGFQDETNVSKPTEDNQKTSVARVVEEELEHESDERDESQEIPIARSSDFLPKPKPQPILTKNKKAQPQQTQQQQLAKQKYLDIKRAQLAKKQRAAAAAKQQQASQELSNANVSITRNGILPTHISERQTNSRQGHDSSRAAPAPSSQLSHAPVNRDQMSSQQSNEYFSVRPKMMDHANQLAIQADQIRSSSIEYESHVTHATEYSSMLPTDHAKHQNRRWTVRNGPTNQQPSKVQVQLGPGAPVKQASETGSGANTTQNKLAASQVSFFKREGQRSMISTSSAMKASNNQAKSIIIGNVDQEALNSEQNAIENSIGSRGDNAFQSASHLRGERPSSKTNAHKINAHMLPSIDRKPQTATNQLVGQQQLNFDFSSAIDRFAQKPATAKNQINGRAVGAAADNTGSQQQVKYLTKTSGLHGMQRNKGKEPTITATQGLLRGGNHAQSMRHMLPNSNYDDSSHMQLLNSQSGISKTKSSIFGGQTGNNISSTATKAINGFGSTQNHHHNQAQANSSKGFCANAIRKGPSFNQMNLIATPTSQIESSTASKLIKAQDERKLAQQSSYNQMLNFKQNLIPTSQSQYLQPHQQQQANQHHRTGSTSKSHQHANKHSQMLHQSSQQSHQHQQQSSTRFNQHSHTLKQVAADEALASLKHFQQTSQFSTQQNPEMATRANKSSLKDQHMIKANSNPNFRSNNDSSVGGGYSHLRTHHSNHKMQHNHHHTASTSSQKKEGSSSRLRQVPSNMMPNSQPIYGNKRNHGNHLVSGQQAKSNKLLTVEQNKPSSFLTGQQQQMATSHTSKQLASGRSYDNVKMLTRQTGSRGSGVQHENHSQQSILQPSNISGGGGYQNLRLRTLKQSNSNQQQDSKH